LTACSVSSVVSSISLEVSSAVESVASFVASGVVSSEVSSFVASKSSEIASVTSIAGGETIGFNGPLAAYAGFVAGIVQYVLY
jgi:hypothetical protein